MKLVLRPKVVADIRAARSYYEDARPGLGEELARDLDRLFARLESFPRSAPIVSGYTVRRAPLRRFPLAVFYQLSDPERMDVLRLIHSSRSPDAWPLRAASP